MADPAFWRKLAKEFLALPRECAVLCAERHWTERDKNDWTWHLSGAKTYRVNFEALARRAALALPDPPHNDLLTAWLEVLVRRGKTEYHQQILGRSRIGTETVNSTSGILYELPRHSSDYCKILESEALQDMADNLSAQAKDIAPIDTIVSQVSLETQITVAAQIQALRLECNWTIEQLAAKAGFDEKTVKRHISGRAFPRLGNLTIYEQTFHKALKREILIRKTPPKRPLNTP